jgi:hypothetical protein
MPFDFPTFFLLLFVIFHGVAFGAGLYEQRVVVPRWMGSSPDGLPYLHPEAMRVDDSGRRFWGFVSTGPLSLLTLINLYFAVVSPAPVRTLWVAACAVTLVERIFTFAFFIPKAVQLMRDDASSTTAALHTASRWRLLNWLRLLLSLAGWLLALLAYGAR